MYIVAYSRYQIPHQSLQTDQREEGRRVVLDIGSRAEGIEACELHHRLDVGQLCTRMELSSSSCDPGFELVLGVHSGSEPFGIASEDSFVILQCRRCENLDSIDLVLVDCSLDGGWILVESTGLFLDVPATAT
jgi:hypothetical protein